MGNRICVLFGVDGLELFVRGAHIGMRLMGRAINQ